MYSKYGSSAFEFLHSVELLKKFPQSVDLPWSSGLETAVMCCESLLSCLSVLFLSMIQKQIAASNKMQVKAPTPHEMIIVVIPLSVLDSSSTDSVGSEVSV